MKSLNFAWGIAPRLAFAAFCIVAATPTTDAKAVAASPFAALVGWWNGQGVLGFKASKPERVKCRATYFADDAQAELKQTIRCATAAGAVEVVSNVKESGGKLTGHWKETIHNFEGDLTGEVTPKGFRVLIQGGDISANMDIAINGNKQVVEIQFVNSSLIGLSLILTKGGA
jgi:hypothetical protein